MTLATFLADALGLDPARTAEIVAAANHPDAEVGAPMGPDAERGMTERWPLIVNGKTVEMLYDDASGYAVGDIDLS